MIRPRFSRDIGLEEGHWVLTYQPSSFCSPTPPHGRLLAGQESINYPVLMLTSLVIEQLPLSSRLPLPLLRFLCRPGHHSGEAARGTYPSCPTHAHFSPRLNTPSPKRKPSIPGGCDENSSWLVIALIYLTRPLTITLPYLLRWRILSTTKIPPRLCLCRRNTLASNQTAPKQVPTQIQMSRGRHQDGKTKAQVTAGIDINPINTQSLTSNPRTQHRARGRQARHTRITKAQGKAQRMIMISQYRQIYHCQGDRCRP